jgi:hypothetical protein
VCPKKLDSMFEISHADLFSEESGFHALPALRPAYNRYEYRVFAVKIDVFGNQNIFKDRKNSSQDVTPARGLLRFAISCSQSNHISLHMDVKERTLSLLCAERTLLRKMVGLIGLEPMTPALSRRCSNQLSYRPGGKFAACPDCVLPSDSSGGG